MKSATTTTKNSHPEKRLASSPESNHEGTNSGLRAWGERDSRYEDAPIEKSTQFKSTSSSKNSRKERKSFPISEQVAEALERVKNSGVGIYRLTNQLFEKNYYPPSSSDQSVRLQIAGLSDNLVIHQASRIRQLNSIFNSVAENAICAPVDFITTRRTFDDIAYVQVRNEEVARKCIALSEKVTIDDRLIRIERARVRTVVAKRSSRSRKYRPISTVDIHSEDYSSDSRKRIRDSPTYSPFRSTSSIGGRSRSFDSRSPSPSPSSAHKLSSSSTTLSPSMISSQQRQKHFPTTNDSNFNSNFEKSILPIFDPPRVQNGSIPFERIVSHEVTFGCLTPSEARVALLDLEKEGKFSSNSRLAEISELNLKNSYRLFLLSQLKAGDWVQGDLDSLEFHDGGGVKASTKKIWLERLEYFNRTSKQNEEFMKVANWIGTQVESMVDPFEAVEKLQNTDAVVVEKKRKIEW